MSTYSAKGHRWRVLRAQILTANRVCAIQLEGCTRYATTVDHITPISKGGDPYNRANLRPACSFCNRRRGSDTAIEPRPTRSRDW